MNAAGSVEGTAPDGSTAGSAIGLSSYAYFWQLSDRVSTPITLVQALQRTADLGVHLFQICDYEPLAGMTEAQLDAVARAARELGVRLEVGTKGIRPEHLRHFLAICLRLDAHLLRTMFRTPEHAPSPDEAERLLRDVLGEFERAGVSIAIETYEQVPTRDVLRVVRNVGSPSLGICLDPGNVVAALESPIKTIDAVAPYVLNLHVKDFAFARQEGWVGFTYSGARLGEGLLDYDHMIEAVRPVQRGINQIVEHWLPWQRTEEETVRLEQEWTAHSVEFLRERNPAAE